MQIPENVVDDVRKRLRRAAGQVQAVERMLSEGRECREVVIADLGRDEGARTGRLQTGRGRTDLLRRTTRRSRRPTATRSRTSSACS